MGFEEYGREDLRPKPVYPEGSEPPAPEADQPEPASLEEKKEHVLSDFGFWGGETRLFLRSEPPSLAASPATRR
eukprot:6062716-Prymnesium_polylepis.1